MRRLIIARDVILNIYPIKKVTCKSVDIALGITKAWNESPAWLHSGVANGMASEILIFIGRNCDARNTR